MRNERVTLTFVFLLIGSVLMVLSGSLIAALNSPIIVSSSSPAIVSISGWEDFKTSASNATRVTYLYKQPNPTFQIDAQTYINTSSGLRPQILTYSGTFPGSIQARQNTTLFIEWLQKELDVANGTIYDPRSNVTGLVYKMLTMEEIDKVSFWGRLAFGLPGLVEGGMAYVWLIFAVLNLVFAFVIYFNPSRQRSLGLWIVVFSFLSLPIGGGFIIGTILGVLAGFSALMWPQSFKETFFGTIINAARIDGSTLKMLAEDTAKMQSAVVTIVLVAILSSLGTCLYAFNVNLINAKDQFSALQSAYNILLDGAVYGGSDVAFGVLAYIGVGFMKWIILSLIVYAIGAKLLALKFEFANMATALAFVYVPEMLQAFTPLLFTNEPLLSRGTMLAIIPIPLTWPLELFYLSRLWCFVIMIFVVGHVMDLSRIRAVGVTLTSAMFYFIANYMFLYPTLKLPGLRLEFTDSSLAILILASMALIIAILLGTFRKEA